MLARREVLAPEAGRVTHIRALTPGASISAGEPVLDLVPAEDRLVAELRLLPTDIDQVTVGQRARLRLTALRQQNPPMLPGQVMTVSPDLQNDAADRTYYLVRVALDPGALDLVPQRSLMAGMPVEGFLIGESRTPLGYFWEPVRSLVRRTVPPAPPSELRPGA
ncbi:HlyD family efflux transporter periplasmic adaptor subunit [Belnapia sp. F-4-1]|uniref:HlyD family efflux transporter periplasmic adaptor subunit n=1 Tax=Belnapia sp. F-4-1 TaxID=1545443 RepID=UPI00068DC6BE|nr:HlyD family efflux transporter periplasmic adaptor subunit [Belnapia sp. F-4-1]